MRKHKSISPAWFTLSFVCAVAGSLSACAQRQPTASGLTPKRADELDVILFEAVLRQVIAQPYSLSVRVDPRPMTNDPRLVTLRRVWEVIPERVSPEGHAAPWADVSPDVVAAREEVLRKLKLPRTDASQDAKCPGALIPSDDAGPKKGCPHDNYYSVLVALPRQGGSYWPDNFDERTKYADRAVHSIRIIMRTLTPNGSSETSIDYLFELTSLNVWKFLEKRPLLTVE